MTGVFSVILERLVNGEQFVASCGGVWYATNENHVRRFPVATAFVQGGGGFVVDSVACSGALQQWLFTLTARAINRHPRNKESVSMEKILLHPPTAVCLAALE